MMTALTTTSGGYRTHAVSGIDRAVRLSTAAAVLVVAGIAAYVSCWHAYAVVRAYGGSGITGQLEPATIDGLVYASSMVILYAGHVRPDAGPADSRINEPDHRLDQGLDERPLSLPISARASFWSGSYAPRNW